MRDFFQKLSFRFFLALILLLTVFSSARADLVDDLKSKIDERNKIIKDLEKEISAYQAEVEKTGAKAKTLRNSIAALELTRKKLSTEIISIENKVTRATLSIEALQIEIAEAEASIKRGLVAIASILRQADEEESGSFVETVLNYPSISTFLDRVQSLLELNIALQAELARVRALKQDLENKKSELQGKRQELINLAGSLSDKKKVAEHNKVQTDKLLTQTKNQEANFRKLLQEKQTLRDNFERELLEYESQLKFAIDPTSLPQAGSGVLKWPVESVKITQTFGDTEFSRANPQAYNGHGHNGIDLKAPIGTKIMSALHGKVIGTGNTDNACPNASYGQWVLIEHPNGLSTLYAHLSVIKVVPGQSVVTGETIGYSGETGYATGPHLHFTVYASQGVEILSRQSKICNAKYTMPIASFNAYLNPLLYL